MDTNYVAESVNTSLAAFLVYNNVKWGKPIRNVYGYLEFEVKNHNN
jgi:hypothetical protein